MFFVAQSAAMPIVHRIEKHDEDRAIAFSTFLIKTTGKLKSLRIFLILSKSMMKIMLAHFQFFSSKLHAS
jgi:hypothetical protein